jgi:hypothetical protein
LPSGCGTKRDSPDNTRVSADTALPSATRSITLNVGAGTTVGQISCLLHRHALFAALFSPAVGTPARSALIRCARALRAWLEPLTPPLRNARRDTGFPAAASRRATMRARSNCGCAGRGPDPEIPGPSCGPGSGPFWSRLADPSRSASGRLRSGPSWSSEDQDRDRRTAGGPVRLSGVSSASASARSMWARAVPMARTRTGRQDTIVVTGHGARAVPAWASRW